MRAITFSCLLLGLVAAAPAHAVFSGDMSPRAESGDKDYAAAIRAKNVNDWPGMIGNLQKVVARRPWHDNAFNLLGYGHRQIGEYDAALTYYEKALELNPRHRDALEYMGVTFLHMGKLERSEMALARLWKICGGMALTFSDGEFGTGCEQWEMLDMVIDIYKDTGEVVDCE